MYRLLTLLFLSLVISSLSAQSMADLFLHHADRLEVIPGPDGQLWYTVGSVVFENDGTMIYCDSAVWNRGKDVRLLGSVIIDNEESRLVADSAYYDLNADVWEARGDYVEIWLRKDSIFAVGKHAFQNRASGYFFMAERPTLYLGYPDSANMIEVVADEVRYSSGNPRAEASGNVRINTQDMTSVSGCAVMYPDRDVLDLFDQPVVKRKRSELSGNLISLIFSDKRLKRIDVIDSANGDFEEPTDSNEIAFDRSRLKGQRIIFDFVNGRPDHIVCYNQAYSWYFPNDLGLSKSEENEISGDTIHFEIVDDELKSVTVIGGAMGKYLSRTISQREVDIDSLKGDSEKVLLDSSTIIADSSSTDSLTTVTVVDTLVDTVSYSGYRVKYSLDDSLISLDGSAKTESGLMGLEAQRITINTATDILNAYSADILVDSGGADDSWENMYQPNPIPVMLKDKEDILYGDFLEYSMETEKGRIIQSKSKYETGFFYGEKAYRESKDIFYVEDGNYTTCDADEPHYNFHSNNLKFIENEKLIAKPVVFSIGRLPILALPYYVFPLKKGRHSGWLPFTFGNIEQGDRYLRNVGYYWAASEYWDWQGALDYFEQSNRLNFYSKINYNKLYSYSGSISGNYARESSFNSTSGTENKSTRWTIRGAHKQTFSPTFLVNASGQFQSDSKFYNDFSTDLSDRLNRTLRSQVNFSKQFSKSVRLSGNITHDENLDTESRTDQLPTAGLTLPAIRPFGSGKLNNEGRLESKWYNNLVITYRPNMANFSQRVSVDSVFVRTIDTAVTVDTTIIFDTLTLIEDTTFNFDSTFTTLQSDTFSFRSRKQYTRLNHAATISFPSKIANYITFNPSFSYREEWFKIGRTDQSEAKGISAGTYRSYVYSTGASMSTKLYGMVYPNMFGLLGLRQVITPTVRYSFTPEINKHEDVRQFAGGSAGSSRKSQSMNFSLNHIYQAKMRKGEGERNLTLVSITSNISYDFEKDTRRFTNLTSSFNSTVLPKVNFYGSTVHSVYKPGTDELDFWSPYLQSFSMNASVNLAGKRFVFDDLYGEVPTGIDSNQIQSGLPEPPTATTGGGPSGWSLSASYSYNESGRGSAFRKSSFIRFSLRFSLTRNTAVSYSQYYSITGSETISNQVNITRKLHCWTGTLFWVPVGSTRGWGFKLFVTALPQIKIDQSQNQLSSGYFLQNTR